MCVGVYVCFHVGVDRLVLCTMVLSCEEDEQRRVKLGEWEIKGSRKSNRQA
jgi:hypothetical protein